MVAVVLTLAVAVPTAAASGTAGTTGAAITTVPSTSTVVDPNTPVLVTKANTPPPGYRLTASQVEAIAAKAPKIKSELRRHPNAVPYEYTKGPGRWQVSWFSIGRPQTELAQVYVDDASGTVLEAWTGFQVAWTMARGYPGAFGRRVNAWYVWIPLCVLFIAPFLPWRRRPALLHLDLLVLVAFSVSLAFFNHAEIGLSVPLAYPCLLYLLARMLLLASGRGRPREPLRLLVPAPWLAVALVFLVGFRVGLNVTDSNVIDVGYAGVIGATKLVHGQHLYGGWPQDNANGDTYGPVNYYTYVPARVLFGWSGKWDNLPASHAAAIAFDLLTLVALYFLGRRIRGPTLGTALAYAWAAYPFSLYVMNSNSNDSLVALLVVLALLAIRSVPGRAIAGALATFTKFAPLALAPLLLRGAGPWPRKRAILGFVLTFAVTSVVVMLPVLTQDNLHAFWQDTISYQAQRGSPFSVWGLWGGLSIAQHLVQGAAAGLALIVAFVPRRRDVVTVAALAAAVLIALQLGVSHWFYLYIVWFFPPVMVAVLGFYPERVSAVALATRPPERARAPALSPEPASARSL